MDCATAVALSTHAALASPLVTTDVVMINLFPYLAVRYQAGDVPATVIDGRRAIVGSVTEDAYIEAIATTG